MHTAELSVVVTAHDVGPWIRQTLESLSDQQLPLDVIVVVDHSSDETLAVAQEAERAGQVRVVQTDVRGGAHARNVGASLAAAPRLAFCDGDDLVPPRAYRTLVDASRQSGAPMTVGSFLKFRPAHTWSPTRRHEVYRTSATYTGLSEAPALLYHRACWNRVFLTSWWREHGFTFPEVVRSNDIVPMTRALLAADRISVVEDHVYLYRERPGSSSMSSRVGTERSLLSYLEQETECARILAAHDRPAVWGEYAHVVLQEDAWIQVGRHLRQRDASGLAASPEVLERCRDLVRRFDAELFARMPLSARLTFGAVAAGADTLASAAALTDDREPATHRAAGWARVLEHGLLDDACSPPADHVWRFGVLPTLDDLLDDDTLSVEDTVSALRRLHSALEQDVSWPSWQPRTDTVVREFLESTPPARADDVGLLRASEVRLERVERLAPGRLRLSGSLAEGVVTAVHLLRPGAGSASVPAETSGLRWTAEIPHGLLPPGASRLAATVEGDTGRCVMTHLRHLLEPLPDPSPTDRLRVRIEPGPANLVLEHRQHVVRRAWAMAFRRS